MSIDIKKKLNSVQYRAVTTIDRPVLVIAGAGSGKTRVIEYRVLHLIQEGFSPESILLLTFTRKAAHEMLIRACKHDSRCELIDGGTFHSFAFKTLKHYAKTIGFNNSFTILDDSDTNELIARCMSKMGLFDIPKRFPKKETLKGIISKSVNKQNSIKAVLEREFPQFEEFFQEIHNLRCEYSRAKIEAGYVDYDDLLVYLKLILERPEIREQLNSRYKHIMVDEYQDTNKLQGDITYLLAQNSENIMAVGDDAQSIYGFRGANHENIMSFPLLFPRCQVIKLEQNYRSIQPILDVSNTILDNMSKKFDKRLSAASKDKGGKPQFLAFKNPGEEAKWIATKVKKLRDEGVDLIDQAVLFRSTYISIPLQAELNRMNIPFQVFGGLKFYETAHVKDMVAHLKILFNPRDELAWSRSLKLIEGVGEKTIEKILLSIREHISFTNIALSLKEKFGQGLSYSVSIEKLVTVLELAFKDGISIEDQFRLLLKYYEPLLKKKHDDWFSRLEDLDTLLNIASGYKSLEQLLADLALEPPQRGVSEVGARSKEEQPLTLSTIHSAKGLEWEAVFLLGVIDGVLPSQFALRFEDEIEEEHRLFYVAVTRAKRQLFLTLHHEGIRGLYQFNRVSRFLENRNILTKLEQKFISQDDIDQRTIFENNDFETEVYDKKTLFKKINDSWRW